MTKIFFKIFIFFLALNNAAESAGFGYLSSFAGSAVQVFDLATNTFTTSVDLTPEQGGQILTSIDGTKVYVLTSGGIGVISTSTNTFITTIAGTSLDPTPARMVLNSVGSMGYSTNGFDLLYVLDLENNTKTTEIFLTNFSTAKPFINNAGTFVYMPLNAGSTIDVVDTSTNTIVASPAVGNGPITGAVTPDDAYAYIVNATDDTVSVLDTSTNLVTDTIPVGNLPLNILINNSGTFAYVSNVLSDTVSVIDLSNNTVVATIGVGNNPNFLVLTSDDSTLYVANQVSNDVSVIRTSDNSVQATVSIGSAVGQMALTQDEETLYVVDSGNALVKGVDTGTNAVTSTIPLAVASDPFFIALSFSGSTPPDAPASFSGKSFKNKFLQGTEYVHQLSWTASPSSDIISYRIYKNGILLVTIPSTSSFLYNDLSLHRRQDLYTLKAVDSGGNESDGLNVILN